MDLVSRRPVDAPLHAFAWASVLWAAMHVVFAAGGGIHSDPVVSWGLALLVVGASVAFLWAARHRSLALAWVALGLGWVPAIVTWPAIGLGVTVFAFLFYLVVTVGLGAETIRRRVAAV